MKISFFPHNFWKVREVETDSYLADLNMNAIDLLLSSRVKLYGKEFFTSQTVATKLVGFLSSDQDRDLIEKEYETYNFPFLFFFTLRNLTPFFFFFFF